MSERTIAEEIGDLEQAKEDLFYEVNDILAYLRDEVIDLRVEIETAISQYIGEHEWKVLDEEGINAMKERFLDGLPDSIGDLVFDGWEPFDHRSILR